MKPLEYEFSPDLSWMLISGQVSDEILLEALYQEFSLDISRLCLAALDNHRLAFKAAQTVFASAVVNRYRYKEEQPVRYWFLQISLESIIKFYNSLNLRRTITANLPFRSKANLLGDSVPESYWEAEIWLTLDRLDFEKRLLALVLYYLQWPDADISAVFNLSPDDLSLNKRYLNSVLLPFRMEKSIESNLSLEERITQSLIGRWPETSILSTDTDQFIRQVIQQIRVIRLRNKLTVSSKEISLTAVVIFLAIISFWAYNHYFPDENTTTPNQSSEIINLLETPTPTLQSQVTHTPTAEPAQPQEMIYIVRAADTLASIARQFDVSFYGLRRNNRIPGNTNIQVGQKLWLFIDPANKDMNLSKFLSKTETKFSQEEFGYLNLPLVRSMGTKIPEGSAIWIEGLIIDYGPDGYIGPPRIEIVQAWFTSEAVLYLVGDEQQKLQEVWLLTDEYQYMATPGIELPWSHAWKPVNPDSVYLESLQLFSDSLSRKSTFSPVIMEVSTEEFSWNGRPTIAYDIKDKFSVLRERQWIDDETKLLIRRQIFDGSDASILQKEVNITKFEENNTAPAGLLDPRIPWRGGFALNYLGQPAPWGANPIQSEQLTERLHLETVAEPQSFEQYDFSQAQLTFQYPQTLPETHQIPAEVFVENQFLGTMVLGYPWTMVCDRSADGSLLAYVSQPGEIPSAASRLHLLDLGTSEYFEHILPFDLGIKMFAFSPDSKRLAVFGYPGQYVEGSLIVVDLANSETNGRNTLILDHLGEASSLAWSPDGEQIAIIARYQSSAFLEEIFIYDLSTGEIINHSPLDFSNPQPIYWPTEEWRIEFPVEMGDLTHCAAAPQAGP